MQTDVAALSQAISEAASIGIASHINPDGDAIGAVLALSFGIQQLGKRPQIFAHEAVPNNLRFLSGWEDIEIVVSEEPPAQKLDLAIVADVGAMDRLGRARFVLQSAKRLAIIDHHQPSDELPGDIRVIDPKASATCLILYRIFPELGIEIDSRIAQHLLTGIATDTGSFRYQNTDPESLDAASHLVAHGANLSEINEEVWERKPLSAIKLLRYALDNMESFANDRIVTTHLAYADFERAGAEDQHSEGIVNEIGRVDTALIAAMFRETKPGKVRVSVRSRGQIDVSAVCREFGGGGHVNAAGCTFDSSIEEAKRLLVPALQKCLASCS